mmetsp:Transcript_43032/g.129232  ORF Transcript_43032/g.129232 Transcript_43032/m.129232 type:complete len:134 (-) Transcript_43032:771-1172(-)
MTLLTTTLPPHTTPHLIRNKQAEPRGATSAMTTNACWSTHRTPHALTLYTTPHLIRDMQVEPRGHDRHERQRLLVRRACATRAQLFPTGIPHCSGASSKVSPLLQPLSGSGDGWGALARVPGSDARWPVSVPT